MGSSPGWRPRWVRAIFIWQVSTGSGPEPWAWIRSSTTGWARPTWGMAFDGGDKCSSSTGREGFPVFLPARFRPEPPRAPVNSGRVLWNRLPGWWTTARDLQGRFATGNFKANRVKIFSLSDDGAGFRLKWEPLIRSSHRNFRPVDVNRGPDGAIYVVDWYSIPSFVIRTTPTATLAGTRLMAGFGESVLQRPLLRPPKLADAPLHEVLESLKAPESLDPRTRPEELSSRFDRPPRK